MRKWAIIASVLLALTVFLAFSAVAFADHHSGGGDDGGGGGGCTYHHGGHGGGDD